jgi:hypothetical protein
MDAIVGSGNAKISAIYEGTSFIQLAAIASVF